MKPDGVFIFIDDDVHEHIMFEKALKKFCDNEIKSAYNGEEAFKLIKHTKENIFCIISDINMPKVNGLELKRMIENTAELKIKSIPFFFHSTHDNGIVVKEAYSMGIQGFIKKSENMSESVKNLELIIKFWSTIVHPNSVK
ncbi:MAG: response regulator [Bacteroidota bacterium]